MSGNKKGQEHRSKAENIQDWQKINEATGKWYIIFTFSYCHQFCLMFILVPVNTIMTIMDKTYNLNAFSQFFFYDWEEQLNIRIGHKVSKHFPLLHLTKIIILIHLSYKSQIPFHNIQPNPTARWYTTHLSFNIILPAIYMHF